MANQVASFGLFLLSSFLRGYARHILLLLLLVAAAGGVFWLALRPSEPVYQGRRLSYWLNSLENWNGDTNDAAFLAFRGMGTNAIPALLNVLQTGGSPFQTAIMKLNQQQSVVHLRFGTPWHQTMAAAWAFYAMGTNAKPALPALTNLFFHTNELFTSTLALAGIAPEGVSVLLTALTNRDYHIRDSAASGLGWVHSDLDVVVPALIASLRDGNLTVHHSAAFSLGHLHALPELTVPALTNDLSNNNPLLRCIVLSSLAEFGGKAEECVPMVVAALNDNDGLVRTNAAHALIKIDPEAAAKAGVKLLKGVAP